METKKRNFLPDSMSPIPVTAGPGILSAGSAAAKIANTTNTAHTASAANTAHTGKAPSNGSPAKPVTWDARLARWLVTPLIHTRVTPNHLTTVRLLVGVAGALAFAQGGYAWCNIGALLIVLSNFIDHTDGELARISGKTSKIGHFYDLAADAFVTVALFAGIGIGVGKTVTMVAPAALLGSIAGAAIALIFFLRMRIEAQAGKAGTRQASFAGFETEDVLYLIPLVTLFDATHGFLTAAAIGAPLFAALVVFDYFRIMRQAKRTIHPSHSSPTRKAR